VQIFQEELLENLDNNKLQELKGPNTSNSLFTSNFDSNSA
jgi:hypothetical protein